VDRSFDAVLCNHVLEHVPDDRKALGEIFRVLKPGGWAILMVPLSSRAETDEDPTVVDPKERERRFGQDDHVRLYGQDYQARLEAAGFHVTMDHFARSLSDQDLRRYVLDANEVIPLCTKLGLDETDPPALR
jgi:ubiquinone/menaquinone biosynthesis C-methylase UbiE